MAKSTFLISCPGETGGLYLKNDTTATLVNPTPMTGIYFDNQHLVYAHQAEDGNTIFKVGVSGGGLIKLTDDRFDLHDVYFYQNKYYLVVTEYNAIYVYDTAFNQIETLAFEGEPDSWHINSVVFYWGKFLVSVFGRFERHRQYKEGTKGLGEIIDVHTGETFIDGLSQPHSLTVDGDLLYVCSSEAQEIKIYRGQALIKTIPVPGYARGLAITDETLFVGLSQSRNTIQTDLSASSTVLSLDKSTYKLIDSFNLPSKEIYDIRIVDNLPAWMLPSLLSAGVEGFKTQLVELNTELDNYKSGYESYKHGYELLQQNFISIKDKSELYKKGYERYKAVCESIPNWLRNLLVKKKH